MRFIPTTTAKVESLKKQAKRIQRNGGGKHADLLNRVARTAGYEHWHHVVLCQRETEGVHEGRSLGATVERILQAERAGEAILIGTDSQTSASQPFLLFSTGIGDAWLLDPIDHRAACLMWRGEPQPPPVRETESDLRIQWTGFFELRGEFFIADVEDGVVGHRAIAGYPVDQLREFLLAGQSADETIRQVIGQDDAVPLTPEIVTRLAGQGWEAGQLAAAARQGARFSPSRNTVLYPPMTEPEF
ncbi:MAG TPA: hypothetical protein PLS95_16965 [Thermoanaerobaculales bacterium]|nr:hypothetical protein [Thermoanaerobaculales bacterium]